MKPFVKETQLSSPELAIYQESSDVQVKRWNEPEEGLFIAESALVVERAVAAGYQAVSLLMTKKEYLAHPELLSKVGEAPVYIVPEEELSTLTGYAMTRGMLAAMQRRPLIPVEQLCASAHRIAILEDVMNPTNIGAIVRSAAALSMDAILFTKGCADPLYRRAIRVSMGTIFQIPWTILPEDGLARVQDMGFATAAMALTDQSVSIEKVKELKLDRLAVIMGTEGTGLKASTIASSTYTVKIPMTHGVDSLNVAAASAVAFWELGKTKEG